MASQPLDSRKPAIFSKSPNGLSNQQFVFIRHSRLGEKPDRRKQVSRLRGMDKALFVVLTEHEYSIEL